LDPNRLARVHARFGGQVLAIGQSELEPGYAVNPKPRPLQFGDAVKKGQLLAVVWSREVGEKKSELLHAISQVFLANRQLAQTRSVAKGSEGERQLSEAERHVKASMMAVERIERTLHSWKTSEDEIEEVRSEAQRAQLAQSVGNPQLERTWAEVKVRAPFDGVVLERNISVGEVVDNRLDLFKIGDVSSLGVTIDVYEEDLPALESLGPESRRWLVRLKSEPAMSGIPGSFDVIANVVDPHRHTISVTGILDNSQGLLRAGQFVTAEIRLEPQGQPSSAK
jgi:cobalt-zinc-cadmium efflux system membrane fusion protein